LGRIGVVAGSKGFIGRCPDDVAGRVASRRRSGGSFSFPKKFYEIVAGAAPMEAMVKPLQSYRDLLKEKTDVWALGPRPWNINAQGELLELIEKA